MSVSELFAGAASPSVAVIAEAGVNHNGDLDLAHRLIDTAVDSDAAAVKFQTFNPDRLTAASASTAPYQQARGQHLNQADLLRQLTLPDSAWRELKSHADEAGIRFLSTPFDMASAELLAELGVDALKLSSGELTNLPFLRDVAAIGLPLLVSTGMGDLDEVRAAVDAAAGAPMLALFHCVSAYPAPLPECNLRAIPAMAADLSLPVGWSDHTEGTTAAVVAVTLGARLLEKHFTLDRTLPGPDHLASLEPDQLNEYVATVQALPASLGDGIKRRTASEEENAPLVRRSWHATRDLARGDVITADDIVALRPESGIVPSRNLVGSRLVGAVAAGTAVTDEALGT